MGRSKSASNSGAGVAGCPGVRLDLEGGGLVVLEFRDKEAMAAALGRVSAYSEGNQAKGTKSSSDAIQSRGYSGHNFPMATLRDFLTAHRDALTAPERELVAMLKRLPVEGSGRGGGGDALGQGRYLIAFLRNDLHTKLHELQHARYYLDGAYREAVARAWAALPAKQQEYVTAFLGRLGYHPSVHLDEWQAYHTTESRNFWGISLQDVDLPQPALLATSSSAHGASTASSRSRR